MDHFNPVTIMVADDDSEDRELFRDLFHQNENFTLMGCLTDGREVFDEIIRKKNIPEVLLIDMYMPFFTGIDLVKALDELHAAPTTFKFVISVADHIPEKQEVKPNPYIIFLKKPTTSVEINALPGQMLSHLNRA